MAAQLSAPLALGLLLEGVYSVAATTAGVPVTGVSTALTLSNSTTDIGITILPIGFGLTSSSANFSISASVGSVPVTGVAVTLTAGADPTDVGVSAPLALGMLLTATQSLSMSADVAAVAVNFAPSESSEIADESTLIGRRRIRRTRYLQTDLPVEQIPAAIDELAEQRAAVEAEIAAINTELTLAALSTDNTAERTQKLQKLGADIAALELQAAKIKEEETFLILILQAVDETI